MRKPSALCGVLLLVLTAVACGQTGPAPGGAAQGLCSPSYQPRELVVRGPLYPPLPSPASGRTPEPLRPPQETSTTDVNAIKKIAAAACSLPAPPADLPCTLELGPSFELRFADTQGRTTTLTAEHYGCQFVRGLDSRRYNAKPLWEALAAAGLPSPSPR